MVGRIENETFNDSRTLEELEEDVQKAQLRATIQQIEYKINAHKVKLDADIRRTRYWKILRVVFSLLIIGLFIFISILLLEVANTIKQNNDALAASLEGRIDSLVEEIDLVQGADDLVQDLARDLVILENKVNSELTASNVNLEALNQANDRIFYLFVFLGGVGSFFGLATWFSNREGLQEEQERNRSLFTLQEKNLQEVNNITTAIAAGATENVEHLNTMLETFQKIMAFQVEDSEKMQAVIEKTSKQFSELEQAQSQQIEGLLKKAKELRRARIIYTKPEPNLQRAIVEFKTAMAIIPQLVLNRYTNADSPTEAYRQYGELYLRRGIIAYYENDIVKACEMLEISKKFYPYSGIDSEEIFEEDQRVHTAFTQFYLALIEKNYGDLAAAQSYIENSFELHGRNQEKELLTVATLAEILSYQREVERAEAMIQLVFKRVKALVSVGDIESHHIIYDNRATLYLGNLFYIKEEWEGVLELYREKLREVHDESFYFEYYLIAQAYYKLGDKKKAQKNKHLAYQKLLDSGHLMTKTALDTLILLNALAYLCTRDDQIEKALEYKQTIRNLWLHIHNFNNLQLRLFSFEKKRLVSKDEFWDEIFSD